MCKKKTGETKGLLYLELIYKNEDLAWMGENLRFDKQFLRESFYQMGAFGWFLSKNCDIFIIIYIFGPHGWFCSF